MAISANTLGQTATTLMEQLSSGTISFESYRNSMSSVISSATNNPEFKDEDNAKSIHDVNIAIRISEGEAPPTRRK
jgi:phospholipase C